MSDTATADRYKARIPDAVRRIADQAAAIHAEAYPAGDQGGEPGGDGAGVQPAGPAPGTGEGGAPLTPPDQGAGGDPPAATGAPPAPAPDPQAPIDWEHRYRSLKGKYDPLLERVTGLESMLAALQVMPPAPAPAPTPVGPGAPAPAQPPAFQPLSQQERDEFGEFVDVAERAAAERFLPTIEAMRAEIAELRGTVGTVHHRVEVDAKTEAYTYLQNKVPDWAELNEDRGFLAWLSMVDPFSMQPRQRLLDAALAANNGPSIASFFLAYKKEIGSAPPAPQPSPPPNPGTPPTRQARTSLEDLAAPGRGRPGTHTVPPGAQTGDKPVYTQSQIKAFYADVMRGKYRGRDDEKARIERDIIAATSEGRVQAG